MRTRAKGIPLNMLIMGAPGWLNRLSAGLVILAQVVTSGVRGIQPQSLGSLSVGSLLGVLSLCPSSTFFL